MSNSIRLYTGFALFLLIVSCSADNKNTTTTSAAATVAEQNKKKSLPQIIRKRNLLTDTMQARIISYYRKQYGNDTIVMDITRSDTIIELTFSNIPKDTTDYNGTLLVADISIVTDIYPVVKGDMNGDGLDDMLVTVHTEGGGFGGNGWWNDHFLFLADQNHQYTLADTKSDGELMNGNGYFFPEKISGEVVSGIGNGYTDTDGHCCPSLFYLVRSRLINGQLKTVEKVTIPKPADFEY